MRRRGTPGCGIDPCPRKAQAGTMNCASFPWDFPPLRLFPVALSICCNLEPKCSLPRSLVKYSLLDWFARLPFMWEIAILNFKPLSDLVIDAATALTELSLFHQDCYVVSSVQFSSQNRCVALAISIPVRVVSPDRTADDEHDGAEEEEEEAAMLQ